MPRVKRTSINLDSEDELGILPDYSTRSNPNPQGPIEEVGPPRTRKFPRRMSPDISSSSEVDRSHERAGEEETNTDENPNASAVPIAGGDENSDESSLEESQPGKKTKISHRTEVESYPIDLMDCETTQEDLDILRMEYSIPNDIKLKIPGKSHTPNHPPRGYVSLHLECFRFSVRLPLQPYFTKILGKLSLSHGQLNSGGEFSLICMCYTIDVG